MRYARGEQHLVHYHPMPSPQEHVFARPDPMRDPVKFILAIIGGAVSRPVPDDIMERTVQEYSYPGIAEAVPHYFNTSRFMQEWIERRTRLMSAWRTPILFIQGTQSHAQPVEFYEGAGQYIPTSRASSSSSSTGGTSGRWRTRTLRPRLGWRTGSLERGEPPSGETPSKALFS